MNKLLKDRVKLIRAMMNTLPTINIYASDRAKIKDRIIAPIRANHKEQFVSLSQDDLASVSYSKSNTEQLNHNKRIKTSFMRYIRRQLEIPASEIRDNVLNEFCQETIANIMPPEYIEKDITFLQGEDITKFYISREDESCMTGEHGHLTELYALNPDKIKLLVYKDTLRGLFWTTDNGTNVVDRLYPSGHKYLSVIKQWIDKRGYVCRNELDESCDDAELSDCKFHNVTLKYNKYFPYMDTFKYGKFNTNNTVTLTNNSHKSNFDIHFEDTYGKFSKNINGFDCYQCSSCNEFTKHSEFVYTNNDIECDAYCDKCCALKCFRCHSCYCHFELSDLHKRNNNNYCKSCYDR